MGGEKPLYPQNLTKVRGSPPHGRGKGTAQGARTLQKGITPAWAGKSQGVENGQDTPQDHPRMGGEKRGAFLSAPQHQGSPPHGRGKVHGLCPKRLIFGITPAWAGKSFTLTKYYPATQDHPRMGGEKSSLLWALSRIQGSPPHGRGKVSRCPASRAGPGITPAWAGKSCWCAGRSAGGGDHPRMGGEKHKIFSSRSNPLGSPPHGRGKGCFGILP